MGMDDEPAALLLALERGEDMADLSELQQREVRKSMEAVHSNRQTLMLEMLQEKMRYGSSHCLTVTKPSLGLTLTRNCHNLTRISPPHSAPLSLACWSALDRSSRTTCSSARTAATLSGCACRRPISP